MKRKLIILTLFIAIISYTIAHPFYVSVTQIDHKEQALQITLKVFVEDLETVLKEAGNPALNLGEPMEHAQAEKFIEAYLNQKFHVKVNGSQLPYQFVGKEVEDDAVWIYLEITNVDQVKELEVYNTIITEKYEGQTNLVHTFINKEKKSLILNKHTPSDKLLY